MADEVLNGTNDVPGFTPAIASAAAFKQSG
jgi:hypothetical protein